jgi:biopolymer transport protein ExbD
MFEKLEDDLPVEVQMAPLIDCVFLLLIFFLVATTLRKIIKELPVELPDSAAAIEVRQEDDLLVIGVNRQGELFIDAQPVSTEMLHERLQEAARKTPQPRIRIDGDRQTTLQQLVQVLDLCQFERLNRVGIHIAEDRKPGSY